MFDNKKQKPPATGIIAEINNKLDSLRNTTDTLERYKERIEREGLQQRFKRELQKLPEQDRQRFMQAFESTRDPATEKMNLELAADRLDSFLKGEKPDERSTARAQETFGGGLFSPASTTESSAAKKRKSANPFLNSSSARLRMF